MNVEKFCYICNSDAKKKAQQFCISIYDDDNNIEKDDSNDLNPSEPTMKEFYVRKKKIKETKEAEQQPTAVKLQVITAPSNNTIQLPVNYEEAYNKKKLMNTPIYI